MMTSAALRIPRFCDRLTPELQADLTRARRDSGRSMNAEILARLKLTLEPDPALQMAEVLQPFFASLRDQDREKLVTIAGDAVEIPSTGKAKSKRKS